MPVIGVVSDTHSLWRPEIERIFDGVSLIVHAGDVGSRAVLNRLRTIAPVHAVFGNVDDPADPDLAGSRSLSIGAVTIHVSHGHELGQPTAAGMLLRYSSDVVVFGHTHRALIERGVDGRLALNPGSAGPRRFDIKPSVARLTVGDGSARAEIIWLA